MSEIEQIADNFEQLTEEFNVPREFIYEAFREIKDARPKKKKRGAPFGNQNARKHGLYSKFLTPERAKMLDQASKIDDLSHEITILRIKFDNLIADPSASTNEISKLATILIKLIDTQKRHFPS